MCPADAGCEPGGSFSPGDAVLRFVDSAGEANDLVVSRAGNVLTFRDAAAPLTAGDGCTRTGEHEATCESMPTRDFVVAGGGGGDRLRVEGSAAEVSAGAPPRRGRRGRGVIGSGDDEILLIGGPGTDPSPRWGRGTGYEADGPGTVGADSIDGGLGDDLVDYSDRAGASG